MFTVDTSNFLVSFFTFLTISHVLYDINIKVIRATADLLNAAFDGEVAEEEEEALCAKCAKRTRGRQIKSTRFGEKFFKDILRWKSTA